MSKHTVETIIEELHDIKSNCGKITQNLISEHSNISAGQVYNHFESLEYAKLEVNIYESEYVNVDIDAREDYEPVLLRLLRRCKKENGKVTRSLIGEDKEMPKISDYRREFETFTMAKIKAGTTDRETQIQLTEEQLEKREDEMIEVMKECEEEYGQVTMELIDDMDTYIRSGHIQKQFGSFGKAKEELLENPDLSGIDMDFYTEQEILDAMEECEQKHGEVKREVFCEEYISRGRVERQFGTFSKAKKKADIENKGRTSITNQKRDELNQLIREDTQIREVIKGCLLGDGSLDLGSTNACLRMSMANEAFLNWLGQTYLEPIVADISHTRTPEKGAKKARKSGFRPNAKAENYSHIYQIRTYRLSSLTDMRNKWYPNGKKRFPDDLELTPLSAKIWYCGDGGINISKCTCGITSKNEKERGSYLEQLFQEKGFNVRYNNKETIRLGKESSSFLEWTGQAPKGFEYKWELQDRDTYQKLKRRAEFNNPPQ